MPSGVTATIFLCSLENILTAVNLARNETLQSSLMLICQLSLGGWPVKVMLRNFWCEFVLHADLTPWKKMPLLWHHEARQNTHSPSFLLLPVAWGQSFSCSIVSTESCVTSALNCWDTGTSSVLLYWQLASVVHFNVQLFGKKLEIGLI